MFETFLREDKEIKFIQMKNELQDILAENYGTLCWLSLLQFLTDLNTLHVCNVASACVMCLNIMGLVGCVQSADYRATGEHMWANKIQDWFLANGQNKCYPIFIIFISD